MERTWKPIAAGILSMFGGAVDVYPFVTVSVLSWDHLFAGGRVWINLAQIVGLFLIPGVLAVIGGYFALRRRRWVLALAGAICGLLPHLYGVPILVIHRSIESWITAVIMGLLIVSIVFAVTLIALSKKEFK